VITIDWQQIIAYLLIGASGLGGIAYGGKAAWAKFRTAKPDGNRSRPADAGPPDGAVEWVEDIIAAMGSAPDNTKLVALQNGYSRDLAKTLRISELEAKP
jgi:hypothetical protein